MQSLALHYLTIYAPLAYLLFFIGMIIEGDLMVFMAAFLAHQGYFEPSNLFPMLIIGSLIGDVLWYALGVKLNSHSTIRIYRWFVILAKPFDDHLKNRPLRSLFLSKFTYGLHHAVIVRLGNLKINFKKFITNDAAATLVWIGLISAIGYSFSASLTLAKHYLRYGEIGLLVAVIIFIIIWHFLNRLSKKKL